VVCWSREDAVILFSFSVACKLSRSIFEGFCVIDCTNGCSSHGIVWSELVVFLSFVCVDVVNNDGLSAAFMFMVFEHSVSFYFWHHKCKFRVLRMEQRAVFLLLQYSGAYP